MNRFDVMQNIQKPGGGKMLLLVMDGLGGLPEKPGGHTELETAESLNLDELAAEGVCGMHVPCGRGITPGSGPAHLGLFGYDPFEYLVGRGVLEALGIGADLSVGDVAVRVNFCTVDDDGVVVNRRGGGPDGVSRLQTPQNERLVEKLSGLEIDGVDIDIRTVKEHRAAIILRGDGLSTEDGLNDSDPQEVGRRPLEIKASNPEAQKTAELCTELVAKAADLLKDEQPANMLLLRGIDCYHRLPAFESVFGPRAAAIAAYPMYRGLAQLVGMTVLPTGETVSDEIDTLEAELGNYDFFYVHVKKTDSYGEDGNFAQKVHTIETCDKLVPRIRGLGFDVIVVTGDHSTPSLLKSHSWHPVPTLLWSKVCRTDDVRAFGERTCTHGGLGIFPAIDLVPQMLANADWLNKYGA
jgi:2,3-bisphosphoglycerate-independent phosphoglycerate mutase